jgi:hypothetical protein
MKRLESGERHIYQRQFLTNIGLTKGGEGLDRPIIDFLLRCVILPSLCVSCISFLFFSTLISCTYSRRRSQEFLMRLLHTHLITSTFFFFLSLDLFFLLFAQLFFFAMINSQFCCICESVFHNSLNFKSLARWFCSSTCFFLSLDFCRL